MLENEILARADRRQREVLWWLLNAIWCAEPCAYCEAKHRYVRAKIALKKQRSRWYYSFNDAELVRNVQLLRCEMKRLACACANNVEFLEVEASIKHDHHDRKRVKENRFE